MSDAVNKGQAPDGATYRVAGGSSPWSWRDLAILAVFFLFLVAQAWLFQHKLTSMHPLVLTDFNDYHVVGRMVASGRAAEAYDWTALQAEQITQTGAWAFMPWAYPPPFTMLVGLLGVLPIWAAYLLFVGGSFVLFYTALRRLAGKMTFVALLFALPAILINAKCGQSGFLSAGLIGWLVVGLRERSRRAGWALGGMIFKPHLAVGIGLVTLLERRWDSVIRAGIMIVALSALATLVLGPDIWSAFRAGTAWSSKFLWTGDFPLERMTSVYAALHRFGAPPALAMAAHGVVSLASAALLFGAWRRRLEADLLLALAVAVSLVISPYTYDYDMVALAIVAALVLPRFASRASGAEATLALVLSWIATSNYLWIGLRQVWYGVKVIDASMRLWTISPLALAALAVLTWTILRRSERSTQWWLYRRSGGSSPA